MTRDTRGMTANDMAGAATTVPKTANHNGSPKATQASNDVKLAAPKTRALLRTAACSGKRLVQSSFFRKHVVADRFDNAARDPVHRNTAAAWGMVTLCARMTQKVAMAPVITVPCASHPRAGCVLGSKLAPT